MIIDTTIFLRIVLENPLLGERYPSEGEVLAVLDTGYEGFLAVPWEVFDALKLGELMVGKGELILPNKQVITTRTAYAAARIVDAKVLVEGLIETFNELDEIVAGQEFLSALHLVIDYCRKHVDIRCYRSLR